MKIEAKLARTMATLAKNGAVSEGTAAGMLAVIKEAGAKTVEAFEELVLAAYLVNGWHQSAGKPEAGSTLEPVPNTVRTYVWEIRAALRDGLKVHTFRTFYELRQARKALSPVAVAGTGKAAGNGHDYPPEVAQDLLGVKVTNPETDTGALFHDMIRLFTELPAEPRLLLGRQLARLMHTYQRKLAAPVKSRRAASG